MKRNYNVTPWTRRRKWQIYPFRCLAIPTARSGESRRADSFSRVFHLFACYCIRTATLVDPRVLPPESLNRTNTRLFAGSNGTVPISVTKTAKVGVVPPKTLVATLAVGDDSHSPEPGFASQITKFTGSVIPPVSDVTVITFVAPTLTVVMAKAFAPRLPGKLINTVTSRSGGQGDDIGYNIDWLTISDNERSVVEDVQRIRNHPLVPDDIPIYGYIYDVKTGKLVEVAEATNAGQAK